MIQKLSFISGGAEKIVHFEITSIIVQMDLDILRTELLTVKRTFMDIQHFDALVACYKDFIRQRSHMNAENQ